MEKSYKFKHIGKNLLKLADILLSNEDLKKYIYYVRDNNPISQPTVKTNLIQNGNIIFNLYNPDILTENKIMLFMNPIKGNFKRYPLSTILFEIVIVMPWESWICGEFGGEFRAFNMADLIAQDIDQQKVAGIGEVKIIDHGLFKPNSDYSGLVLMLEVNSSTMKGF